MRTRTHITIAVIAATLIGSPAQAAAPTVRKPHIEPATQEHPDLVLLRQQMIEHPELPPIDFWLAVAWCETHREWDRGHDWGPNSRSWVSGGLGLAHSTWQGYGGRQFARKAAKASKWAQMIVANRVGFVGHQTKNVYMTLDDKLNNRPFYRPAAGFGRLAGKVPGQGWGGKCREAWFRKHGQPRIPLATVKARAVKNGSRP